MIGMTLKTDSKTSFDKSVVGRVGCELPPSDVPEQQSVLPQELLRAPDSLQLPELSELDVVRHFTQLSRKNFAIDLGFYPLGSCTMKYNPKINEDTARLPGFAQLHPELSPEFCQGSLQLMYELQEYLKEILGMEGVTLQPNAGAHGELTGIMIMKTYFNHKEPREQRTKILIPDSAHGTNPASAALCGYECVGVKTNAEGYVDLDDLKAKMTPEVAGIMLTNPNTLGLFECDILKVTQIVHEHGGLVYGDGANLNAIVGVVRPGDLGFDIMHVNLHKTFSTPHGGGGPGSGPVGVKAHLVKFLPNPRIVKEEVGYSLDYDNDESIGQVRTFYGNFGMFVRAYTYIRALGNTGVRAVAEYAVLNANYLMHKLKNHYHLPYNKVCKHEFILTDKDMPHGVTTNDIAKRLLDHGFHSPTIYFPLIVHGAIMIEPTETESKETLDAFAETMIKIKEEAEKDPEMVKKAPHTTPVSRVDSVLAARQPKLKHEWACGTC